MPLRRNNTRTFDRCLYAGETEKVTLLKRNDDQQQGTVRSLTIFRARRSSTRKTGQSIQHEMSSDHHCDWWLPLRELQRVGVTYLNVLDRIVQTEGLEAGRYWQPESTTNVETKLFGNMVKIECLRVDPPAS